MDFDKIHKEMNSPEFLEKAKKYFEELKIKDEIYNKRLEKFHKNMTQEMFDEILEKIKIKYDSDEYYDRWMNQGIEPPRDLEYFLHDYAKKYGYYDDYTEWSIIHGWIFQIIYGQGCVVRIWKDNRKIKILN